MTSVEDITRCGGVLRAVEVRAECGGWAVQGLGVRQIAVYREMLGSASKYDDRVPSFLWSQPWDSLGSWVIEREESRQDATVESKRPRA